MSMTIKPIRCSGCGQIIGEGTTLTAHAIAREHLDRDCPAEVPREVTE